MAATVMNPLLDPGTQPRKQRILAHLQPPFLPLFAPPPRPGADATAEAGSGETRMRRRRSSTLSDYFRPDGFVDSVAVDGKRHDESPVAERDPFVGGEREEFSRDGVEDGRFWSPRDTSIIASCSRSLGTSTPHSEFYDAVEDFGSDSFLSRSSSPSSISKNESEFHDLRLGLSEEIEKRKTAEAALIQMQRQWQRLAEMFSRFGVSLPVIEKYHGVLNDLDFAQIPQAIISAKSASEAIASVIGAEAVADMEAILEAKNRDVSRLQNRVKYYLTMNREMSLRNQELAYLSSLKREKRRKKYRWIWSCLGLSLIMGSSLLVSSYSDYNCTDLFSMVYHDNSVETRLSSHNSLD
ncbi:uncharacterized protein LOC121978051 [Zingiber officinale]|uniref:uncharacterized protein LOC121978051 n=1 Tax=Zingiber officinale TaxID=94328 RepID=UPI001C4D8F73|nr:uncharacterized protein LOC121978051 [Zingiber officinale]